MTSSTDYAPENGIYVIGAAICAAFSIGLSFGVGLPLTALTFEEWGQPAWMIGLAGAAPAFGLLVALPLVPLAARKFGSTLAILGGCGVGALCFLAMHVLQGAWFWIALRFIMCAGLAFPWLITETWINVATREEVRGRVIACYAMTFFIGFSIGPAVLQVVGISGWLPFLVAAIGVGASAGPLFLVRRKVPSVVDESRPADLLSAAKLAPIAMAGGFIGGFAEMTSFALLPNVALAAQLSQQDALFVVSVMAAGGLALQLPLGWLGDKISRAGLLLAVAAVFVLLLALLPWFMDRLLAASILCFILGGAVIGFYAIALSIIGERVPHGALAAANGVFLMLYQIGGIVGPIGAGIAMTAAPISGFVISLIALTVISVAAVAIMSRPAVKR